MGVDLPLFFYFSFLSDTLFGTQRNTGRLDWQTPCWVGLGQGGNSVGMICELDYVELCSL